MFCRNTNERIAQNDLLVYGGVLMPATPIDRLKNPLRKLRVILGEYGAPMSQEDFAKETGLSVNTLRSVENERLPLSETVLTPISARWLAMWNKRDQEWHFLQTKKLYSKELAAKVLPTRPTADRRLIVEKLLDRLRDILASVTDEALPGQAMLLNQLLTRHVEETELRVNLEPTEPIWFLRAHPKEPRMWLIAKYRERKKRTQTVPKRKRGPKTEAKRASLSSATA
jgi:transcriptional regulator with XRE-family HTH domain